MANPNITASSISATVNAFLPSTNLWLLQTPSTGAADGYLLAVANTQNLVPSVSDPNNSLLWNHMTDFSAAMPSGYTASVSVYGAPLPCPLGGGPLSWGNSLINVQFPGRPDAAIAAVIAIAGDWKPCFLTWDRGVLDGPIFFSGDNTSGPELLSWSTATFDTLNLACVITDNGSYGGSFPNGWTGTQLTTHIQGTNFLELGLCYNNTTGQAVSNAKLAWQLGNSVNMAVLLWSMSDAAGLGGGTLNDNVVNYSRQPSKVRMLSRINK